MLIATTAAEVGIDLPNLRRLIVVDPSRFGLSALHQLRGRLARRGGVGHCDLYAPGALPDKSRERLGLFCQTNDGFEISRHDMKLRGVGDLTAGAAQQSGPWDSLLKGCALDIDDLETIMHLAMHWLHQ